MQKADLRLAEIVQSRLVRSCPQEPVFRAAAVAGKAPCALSALRGQAVAFVLSERVLPGGRRQIVDGGLGDVAQFMGGIDIVVAGKNVAVMFDGQLAAARFGKPAQRRWRAEKNAEHGVEILHEHPADVAAPPFIEDGAQEISVAVGRDAP